MIVPRQKPPRGTQIDKSHPLARGLVAAWLFNEGAGETVWDYAGPNHGTMTNMEPTDWQAGPHGFMLNFDNSGSDYIAISASPELLALPTTYNFSAVFRFNEHGGTRDRPALAWAGTDDLLLYPNDDVSSNGGTRVFWRNLGGNIIIENVSDLSYEWHDFVFVSRASNSHEVYRDGVSVGTSSATGSAGPFDEALRIAAYYPGPQFFDGQIEFVYIYARALTENEIKLLHANPYVMFDQPSSARHFYLEEGVPIPVFVHHYKEQRMM